MKFNLAHDIVIIADMFIGTRHYEGVGNQLHYPLQSYQQSALPPRGPGDSDPQKEKELC